MNLLSPALLAAVLTLPAAAALACPTHRAELPQAPTGTDAKHVETLLDTPFVKVVSITLRAGKVLEAHTAPVPVTIQALSGSGVVRTGEKRDPVSPGHLVLVAPKAEHEVVPDDGQDLVLLVHYLKNAGGETAAACPHCAAGAKQCPNCAGGGDGKQCPHCAGAKRAHGG